MPNWINRILPILRKRTTPTATDWWLKNVMNIKDGGVNVTPTSSLGVSAVYAAVNMIAGTISSVPLNPYQRYENGRRVAIEHDQYYILKHEPNPLYSSFQFRHTLVSNYLLWGNGYAEIKRNGYNRPVKYVLLHPSRVSVEWSEDGDSIRYVYEEPGKGKRHIAQSDMYHISDLNYDGVTGLSKISLAAESIGISLNSAKFANDFYKNGTHLGGWLEFQVPVKPEDIAKLQSSWSAVNGGMNNIGKVAILDRGTKYNPHKITMPLSDMEFVESQKFQISDIARIFNIPNHKLNDLSKSNFTNILQQNIEYVENCILPIAVLMEQEFNRKIFRLKERGKMYTKLELKGLLRGDIESQTEFTTKMWDRGIFSINDVREFFDMNPVENGDYRFVPMNYITLEKAKDYDPNGEQVQQGGDPPGGNGE